MPEYRECLAHFLFLEWFLKYCQQKGLDLHVLDLWTDKTAGKNAKRLKSPSFVFKLDHNSKEKRGNQGNQGNLWPPMWRKSSEHHSISLLEWKEVRTTSRAIILNFGALHFQVSTGTVLYIFPLLVFLFYFSLHTLLTPLFNVSTSLLGTMSLGAHQLLFANTALPLQSSSVTM
jgi:hypothetical protein